MTREQMQDRIEELEELLGLPMPRLRSIPDIRSTFDWRLLGLLMRRTLVTREFAFTALYGGLPEADQPKDVRIIDQRVYRLNLVLRRQGMHIETERFTGYYLDEKTKTRLCALVADEADRHRADNPAHGRNRTVRHHH